MIKHVVRCDAKECQREERLMAIASTSWHVGGIPSSSWSIPSHWIEVKGEMFCSWACLAAYATAKAAS